VFLAAIPVTREKTEAPADGLWPGKRLCIVEASPETPIPRAPPLEIWRDNAGRICAYGYAREGQRRMWFPGLAEFRFTDASSEIMAVADRPVRRDLIEDTYRSSVLAMALQAAGREVLHASAVMGRGGVVAFCAVSGTGKSTVAFALSQRGFPLWADDAVAFQMDEREAAVLPLPFRLRLRQDAADFLGCDCTPEARGSPMALHAAPLAAVCVLEQGLEPAHLEVHRLTSSRAFTAVLPHAYCFSLADPERRRLMVRHYLALAACVPVFQIRLGNGLEKLPAILDGLEKTINSY
jgi:hypothetical protein